MDNHMDLAHLQMPKHLAVPQQEEPSDLEELEQFAKAFKQRRIKLGFTQVHFVFNVMGEASLTSQAQITLPHQCVHEDP